MSEAAAADREGLITFDCHPESYKHWTLAVDGAVARLTLEVDEDGGLKPGYKLKLNSYDLGVDIELRDALDRIRFEHPGVGAVVVTSGRERMFCAGANIYMLGQSSHAWKVNFCKFTNETRNGIEDSSRHSGLKFLAALNGTTAGGGYELALACDEILLVDDRSSAVSLPEVPLLGVLPGTGGLTRLTDKRKVRRDLADVFCTNPDGVRGKRAKDWGLVDDVVSPSDFAARVDERAAALAEPRDAGAEGVALPPLERRIDAAGYHYRWVDVAFAPQERVATITVKAPNGAQPKTLEEVVAAGAAWWPLAVARELDDAILLLRVNQPDLGTLLIKTEGEAEKVLESDATLLALQAHWFARETLGFLRRTLARLDVTSRSLFAIIESGSCFAGSLYEMVLAADRAYMIDPMEGEGEPPAIALGAVNFGTFPMVSGKARLAARFYDDEETLAALKSRQGEALDPAAALDLGLVTFTPDDLDWEDEIRLLQEERASLSPDALTGLEASLRFGGAESLETKIFGRLSAWQNWIFNRPNAVGDKGALRLFGSGSKAEFDWERI